MSALWQLARVARCLAIAHACIWKLFGKVAEWQAKLRSLIFEDIEPENGMLFV